MKNVKSLSTQVL